MLAVLKHKSCFFWQHCSGSQFQKRTIAKEYVLCVHVMQYFTFLKTQQIYIAGASCQNLWFFPFTQRHNCIHIFMIYQLHALIVNYMHTVHLMGFSLCLLTLELNYKGKQAWQGSRWFLEWSEVTPGFCGVCGRNGFCAHGFVAYLWMPMQAPHSSYSKTVGLEFTEKYLSLVLWYHTTDKAKSKPWIKMVFLWWTMPISSAPFICGHQNQSPVHQEKQLMHVRLISGIEQWEVLQTLHTHKKKSSSRSYYNNISMQNQTCTKITKDDHSGNRILCFTFIWRQSGDPDFHPNPQEKPSENQNNYRCAICSTVVF